MGFHKTLFDFKQYLRPQERVFRNDLFQSQTLSSDAIMHLNWLRRKQLLADAAHTEFYRKRFKSCGMNPEDIRDDADFEKIPPLTRADICDCLNELLQDDIDMRRVSMTSTGGSTGVPLKLYRRKNLPYDGFAERMLGWWGSSLSDSTGHIFRLRYAGMARVINFIKWWPTLRLFLDAGVMTADKMALFVRRAGLIRIELLIGYVGGIAELADYLDENGLKFPRTLKAVWTTAAPLPEFLRQRLEKIFQCPVYSQYGSCEVGHIAAECGRQNGLHISADWRHLEFVDEKRKNVPRGEWGDVLVTDMLVSEFPLIRYEIGDRGRLLPHPCDCGCNLPLMDKVKGRVCENFYLPDGGCIAGEYLSTIFDAYPDVVSGFQIRQMPDYSVVLRYVTKQKDDAVMAQVKDNLKMLFKGMVPIHLEETAHIEVDRGKCRFVICELPQVKKNS